MKSRPSLSNITNRFIYLPVVVFLVAFSGCKDDDASPDTRTQFVGSYEVEDISESSGYTYNYDISIVNGTSGELEISNFADLFNVPVKATVDGKKITIKSQSFTNPNSGNTIEVSGEGTIEGDVLSFTYTTTGYLEYTGTCTATKK